MLSMSRLEGPWGRKGPKQYQDNVVKMNRDLPYQDDRVQHWPHMVYMCGWTVSDMLLRLLRPHVRWTPMPTPELLVMQPGRSFRIQLPKTY